MAWNIPGKGPRDPDGRSGNGREPAGRRRSPWAGGPRGPGGLGALLDRLRGLVGGGGGPGRWIALALGLWLVMNCFVLVTEQQRGVVLRFGQFARTLQPGPHLKFPWPIERVFKVNATQSKAFTDNVPVLTADGNMVTVEINVQYRVGDPQRYLFGSRDADNVLQQAAQSAVREMVGRSDLDTVLGARSALTVTVRDRLQRSLEAYRTGLVVTELNLPNARPPEEVKDAFDEAQRASQDKNTAINQSQAYAKQVVPEARGEAQRVRTSSEGYRTAAIARATGDAQRFSLLLAQYQAAPEVTRKRLWLETVQQVLADNRKVVGGDGRQLIYVPMGGQGATPGTAATPAAPNMPIVPADVITGTPPETTSRRPERSGRPDGRTETGR